MSEIKFSWPAGKSSAIFLAENIIDENTCSNVLTECKKYYQTFFSPGPTLGGIDSSVKNSMDMSWSYQALLDAEVPTEPLTTYENIITQKLFQTIEMYREAFRWLWTWTNISDTGFRVQEYRKGIGFYREHIDGGIGPQEASNRILAAIIYLNTVEVGGGTFFREHDLMVPARAGSICLFPTNWTHPHQGCVPISDDKWIISTFIVPTPLSVDSKEIILSSTPMPNDNKKS